MDFVRQYQHLGSERVEGSVVSTIDLGVTREDM